MNSTMPKLLLLLCVLVGPVTHGHAGTIIWGAPVPISQDRDLYTVGTLVSAYSFNAGASTVNGVSFQSGVGQLSVLGSSFSLKGFSMQYTGFGGNGREPFSKLSAAYQHCFRTEIMWAPEQRPRLSRCEI